MDTGTIDALHRAASRLNAAYLAVLDLGRDQDHDAVAGLVDEVAADL